MPEIVPGRYRVKYDLCLHKRAGLSSERMMERIKAGEYAEIRKVKRLRHSIWGETMDGWILLYMNQTFYISI